MLHLRSVPAILTALACAGGLFQQASADDVATAGRSVLEKNKGAVVTVKLVIKSQFAMGGSASQENEGKSEATGTVIDPSGLTVLSLTATDPTSLFRNMLGDAEGMGNMKVDSQISDVKILRDDGTEVRAKVVLRDKDLDLAFIRPDEPVAQPFMAVDLAQSAQPQLLDQVVCLNRLGRAANRVHAVAIKRIEALISKPRTFYFPSQGEGMNELGTPCFTTDGKVVGITTLRVTNLGPDTMRGLMEMMSGGATPMAVILPAADIAEGAKQAPQADKVPAEPVAAPAVAPAATPPAAAAPVPAPVAPTPPAPAAPAAPATPR